MRGTRSTLVLFKPKALKNHGINTMLGKLCEFGNIQGFTVAEVRTTRLTKEKAQKFYAEHEGKPFYDLLVNFISSRNIVAIRIEYDSKDTNFIDRFREQVIGCTDPNKAAPGTMRFLFGARKEFAEGLPANGVHASDSPESARRELKFFFKHFNS